MKTVLCATAMVALLLVVPAVADDLHSAAENTGGWTSGRPDGHAPIGVMGDHMHGKGEWMLGYRYMYMRMDGNRNGTSSLSTDEVLDDYMVAPLSMDMQMHMFSVMYAPSGSVTLMAMAPYQDDSMVHQTRMGTQFTTEASGFGDVMLTALVKLVAWDRQRLQANLGVSMPTGSITKSADTPAGSDQRLPYPMQLGSGTWDVVLGFTYLGQTASFSWGAQTAGIFRTGSNDEGYSLGDVGSVTAWGAADLGRWLSASARVAGRTWGNIDGADPNLNPMMVPTADPGLRGGDRIDAGVGVNFLVRKSALEGLRFAIEYLVPLYQKLDGPQLEQDWAVVVGAQYAGAF